MILNRPEKTNTTSVPSQRTPARGMPGAVRWPIRVLMIGSDANLGQESSTDLLRQGIELHPYSEGAAALLGLSQEEPAAIIAPTDMRGVEILQFIDAVSAWADVPVIVGVAGDTESYELAFHALEHGARALLALPFTAQSLADTLHQLGAYGPRLGDPALTLTVGPIILEPQAFRVKVDGKFVALTPREFQLLKYLMNETPRVVTAEELTAGHGIYDDGSVAGTRVALGRLRKKLQTASPEAASVLETVRGLGYRVAETS
ncbi:response regulator transcription factor [Cryobacterium cryoconiti]|uniref:Response regulator transcription factor n=1 Tax=Cryobacterium cryoconiti TaxID=1259239 RepID=A0A4Y8JYM0_9MICO|nr:response regulator transcription factor [Cryobacterium cryoconiti]TFD31997.1 response regulator transcription factor [Cryobacterium cryoconiti]